MTAYRRHFTGMGKPTVKRAQPEHEAQCRVIQWAKQVERTYEALQTLYAVPNAARRSLFLGRKMKAEGLRSGIPDLVLPVPNQDHHALYIEMKAGKNGLSAEQKKMIPLLESYGNQVVVCRSWQAAVAAIQTYLGIAPGKEGT